MQWQDTTTEQLRRQCQTMASEPRETLYVFLPIPRCRKCGSANLKSLRSVADVEGTRTRRTRCRDCDAVTVLVYE